MPRIVGVATATPKHAVSREALKKFAKTYFGDQESFAALEPMFDEHHVENRYLTVSLDWFNSKHSFVEINDLYVESALALAEKVTRDVMKHCAIEAQDFDLILFVSTTGLSTPRIDARLLNSIGLNPHIKRIPIWGLGCTGGAAALSRAYDYLQGYPEHRVLIVAVELCGLAFQMNAFSKLDIYSSALFGEGAAACVVVGDSVVCIPSSIAQLEIIGSLATTYPDTLDAMTWRVTGDGFRLSLAKRLPEIISRSVKEEIDAFLSAFSLTIDQLKYFVIHPGGVKLLEAYAQRLGVPIEQLNHSTSVLREYGNMSSVTVLFVLKRFLKESHHKSGELGLLGALGPGFSSELVLLRWE